MVTGVMLTRAQPFHKGHMDVVNQILKENERCLIVIGSANKCNTERNPLMITDRTRMITHVLKWHNLTQPKVQLLPLCERLPVCAGMGKLPVLQYRQCNSAERICFLLQR